MSVCFSLSLSLYLCVSSKIESLFLFQLYSLVLSLEDLERRALALPEEDRPQMLIQRDKICLEMVCLLNLKATRQQWTKYENCFAHNIVYGLNVYMCVSLYTGVMMLFFCK